MNYFDLLLVPVIVLFTLLTANCQLLEFPSESVRNLYNPVQNQPKFPGTPDCVGFPGSPQWNKCWAKFHEGMSNFQSAMDSYSENLKKQASMKPNGTSSNYYSSNSYSSYSNPSGSSQSSTSTLSVNGYYIKTVGIPVSAQSSNGFMKISLNCGDDTEFSETREGQELQLKFTANGTQKKSATVTVPPQVKMEEVKVERKGDILLVTGPGGGGPDNNFSSTSFQGTAYGPLKLPILPMPPKIQMPVMPQFPSFPMNFPFKNNMWSWRRR